MIAGLCAVLVNLTLNYILIFGHFGFPKLGVAGAAIATVISRFVELLVVALWTQIKSYENKFIIGAFKSFRVPMSLVKKIAQKGIPLMINGVRKYHFSSRIPGDKVIRKMEQYLGKKLINMLAETYYEIALQNKMDQTKENDKKIL